MSAKIVAGLFRVRLSSSTIFTFTHGQNSRRLLAPFREIVTVADKLYAAHSPARDSLKVSALHCKPEQHTSKSTSWRFALSREDHDSRKLRTRPQIWRHVGGPVPRLPPPMQCLQRFCSRPTMQLHLWNLTSATPLDGAHQLRVNAAWAVLENQPAQDPAPTHCGEHGAAVSLPRPQLS